VEIHYMTTGWVHKAGGAQMLHEELWWWNVCINPAVEISPLRSVVWWLGAKVSIDNLVPTHHTTWRNSPEYHDF